MTVTSPRTADRGSGLRRRFLFIATVVAIADGFDASLVGISLPVILARGEFGVTPESAGTVASAQLFGMLVGAVLAGFLADRIGKKKVVLATLTLFAVFTLGVAVAPGYSVFLVFRFLAGIGIGGVVPTLIAYVPEYSLPERRFANNTIMLVGTAIGALLAPLAGIALLAGLGLDFRVLWVIGGVFGLFLIPVTTMGIPESWAYLQTHGQPERAASLRSRYGIGDEEVPEAGDRPRLRTLFTREFRWRTILIAISAVFVIGGSTAFPTWLPQYLVLGGVQFNNALVLTAIVTLGMIVGCLVGGRMQDRGNPRLVVAAFLLLTGISLAAIGLALGAPFWVVLLLLLFYGLVNNPYMFNGLVANVFPPHLRGSILSIDFGVGRAAAVVAAALGGAIAAANLPPSVNFLLWAILPLAGALTVFLMPAYRGRDATASGPAASGPASAATEPTPGKTVGA
jgi:AAHS family benzoate transporter-like MFS transporter